MQVGKAIRMERITNRQTGRTVIVPLDHGVTVGPIPGVIDLGSTVTRSPPAALTPCLATSGCRDSVTAATARTSA